MTPDNRDGGPRDTDGRRYSLEQYKKDFTGKEGKSIEWALDTRKFEIDLYWKRTAYFWAFVAPALGGFLAVQASDATEVAKGNLSVILSCLGAVFSCAWYCVNRGSKKWQENWENHVDLLEDFRDSEIGPLYKVVLERGEPVDKTSRIESMLTGPYGFSVSKINLLISVYFFLIWVILLGWQIVRTFSFDAPPNYLWIILVVLSAGMCFGFRYLGKSSGRRQHKFAARKRKSRILD